MKKTIEQAEAWLKNAMPSTKCTYHEGDLGNDRSGKSNKALLLNEVAGLFMEASDNGRVHLVQQRIGPSRFEYIAIKR